MRSLSVGLAGVLLTGAAITSATVATANSADSTPANTVLNESTLASFTSGNQSLVASFGLPSHIVLTPNAKSAPAKAPKVTQAPVVKTTPVEKFPTASATQSTAAATPESTVAPAVDVPAVKIAPAESPAPVEIPQVAKNIVAAPTASPTEPAQTGTATQVAAPAQSATTQSAAATQSVAPVAKAAPAAKAAPVAKVAPAAKAAPAAKPAPAPAAKSTLQTATASAKRNAVVAAARGYAAVNAQTDCTMLATNSLRSAGVNFHGWPADYLQLGHTVSAAQAQPGDLIYYASNGFGSSHIAVYIGNGMAVHGGWNGMGTAEFSANLPSASAPVFISVDAYNN